MRSLLRAHQLRSVWRRKFIHTTNSKHAMPVAVNVLDRQFVRASPNEAWVSDITYIRTRSGWLYLAAVLDQHSRKRVGDGCADASNVGVYGGANGYRPAQPQGKLGGAFRPGIAIRQ